MEGEETKITFFSHHKGTVHSKEEIEREQPLDYGVFVYFFRNVFVVFPGILQGLNIEFGGADKLTAFAPMPFQNR